MCTLSKDLDYKVRLALESYTEYQVAHMFNLRIGAVRAVKIDMLAKATKEVDANLNNRRQQEMFESLFKHTGVTGRTLNLVPEGLRTPVVNYNERTKYGNSKPGKEFYNQDFAGLEAHVLSGFFLPNGQPTPAFWGFVKQYVKKSGHALLDILHDQEIFAPEQLKRALDIDLLIEEMTTEQLASIMQRASKKVYQNAISNTTDPSADVSCSE